MDWSEPEVLFAVGVVEQASRLAQEVRAAMAAKDITKGDLSPVTVADFAVQAVVGHALGAVFPEAVLVGEETSAALREAENAEVLALVAQFTARYVPGATAESVCEWIDRGGGEPGARFWTLDPIDGTKGYLRGGQYAIALALIEDGKVVLGALGCPALAEDCRPQEGDGAVAVAKRGAGAWSRALNDGGFHALRVSPCAVPANARMMRSFEAGHTNVDQVDDIAAILGVEGAAVGMDSQAKYAVLAAGGGELLFRLLSPKRPDYKEMIWDQAAGAILLEEAGGTITDLQGNPLDFGQGKTLARNRGVFASNGPLHEAGLAAIAAAGAA
jgi:3'(2'), 5'-bisphosphate nucleotidase